MQMARLFLSILRTKNSVNIRSDHNPIATSAKLPHPTQLFVNLGMIASTNQLCHKSFFRIL